MTDDARATEKAPWTRARAIIEATDLRLQTDKDFPLDYGIRQCVNADRVAVSAETTIRSQREALTADLRKMEALFEQFLRVSAQMAPGADSNFWLSLANVIRAK